MRNLIALLISVIVSMHYATAQDIGKITKSECFLEDCSLSDNGAKIEFGYLTVPENYSNPTNKTYQIAFVIIKARNGNSKPDPILYLMGGWGAESISRLGTWTHHKLTADRDMILYDYRGLGYSEPDLSNLKPAYDEENPPENPEGMSKYTTRRTNKILDALEENNIDINMFGTDTNAKDGLLLAENLGYESYNLFGISNGTLTIQNFIRFAEDSSINIRSAILDSNVPMGYPVNAELSTNFSNSLNSILSDCANDPDCSAKYPKLKARYKAFLQSLEEHPLEIKTEKEDSIKFGRDNANAILFFMLYRRSLFPYIPLVIESMINKEKGAISKYYAFPKNNSSSLTGEFVFPIIYTYDAKMMRDQTKSLLKATQDEDEEFILDENLRDFYYTDNRIIPDSLSILPIKTDVPTLIFAGSYDPITPPSWSESIRPSFKNHYYFNIPKVGHGVTSEACGTEIALAFLKNPNEKPVNNCINALGENDIIFVSDYYKNLKIETLVTDLFTLNWFLIIGLALVVLISLYSFIYGVISLARRRSSDISNWVTVNSFLILTMLIVFSLIIAQTVEENPVLIILGLIKTANYILWLVPIIILISVILFVKLIKKESFLVIHKMAMAAFIIFCVIAFNYALIPNFL
ncbi:alpha/beta fold hydrolase [Gelidibacter salicanalis]|uniref:Alpha/beta fold hydrolase n=1 Tax=Gelidibacter salicanalis TaxID=291193 RepID=A0A5C7AA57_9FLAO|nr:alpha/beta hydrolase [Gelidibacter salicanalis]TXE04444.1 alpha/beta fold hydrolase [Gelidibacter salicanalis]